MLWNHPLFGAAGKRILSIIKGEGNEEKIRKDLKEEGRFPELWIGDLHAPGLQPLPWILRAESMTSTSLWLSGLQLPTAASSHPATLFSTPKSRKGENGRSISCNLRPDCTKLQLCACWSSW